MKDKSVRLEQIRLASVRMKEDAAAWGRALKSIKASKAMTTERFKKN